MNKKTMYQKFRFTVAAFGFGVLLMSPVTGRATSSYELNSAVPATLGTGNAAFGLDALRLNTASGNFNSALGDLALYSNLTGSNNTASGYSALYSNTAGAANTANGYYALRSNVSGSGNTASGYSALWQNTGSYNTAYGTNALFSNIGGGSNVAVGNDVLLSNNTGSVNTAVGSNALYANTSGYNNTASGASSLRSNNTGYYNTATGMNSLFLNTNGHNNVANGLSALSSNTTGWGNTALGANANVSVGNLTNATAIGYGAIVNASNKIRLGNTSVTVIEGQVPYTWPSDRSKKENFQPVDGEEVLRKLRGLNLTSWNYIGHDAKEFRHYGPMAQEFYAAFGKDSVGTIGTPTTINSGDIIGILMIAVQALEKQNTQQTAELTSLKANLSEFKAENAAFKAQLERIIGTYETASAVSVR